MILFAIGKRTVKIPASNVTAAESKVHQRVSHMVVCLTLISACLLSQNILAQSMVATQTGIASSETVAPASDASRLLRDNELPSELRRYQVAPWKLLLMPEFKTAFERALKGKNFTPWVSQLSVVHSLLDNKVCLTPHGIAFLYIGYKPHFAEDYLRLVYFPVPGVVGLRVHDSVLKDQTGDFGTLNATVIKILNNEICQGN